MLILNTLFVALMGAAAATVAEPAAPPAQTSTTCTSSVLTNPTAVTPYKRGAATKSLSGQKLYKYDKIFKLPFKIGIGNERGKTVAVFGTGEIVTAPYGYARGFDWIVYGLSNWEIVKGKDHGVFYSIEGAAPKRSFNLEWRLGVINSKNPNSTWHFGVQWYEEDPDLQRMKYWNIPEKRPQGTVEVDWYHGYYDDGTPKTIETGDVLLFRTTGNDYSTGQFYPGPRSACQYRGPPDD